MQRLWTFLACSIGVTLVAIFSGVQAATLIVSPSGQSHFPTLQAAIAAAAPGDTVLALPGTYSGPGNRDLDFLGKDLSLIGRDGSAFTTIDCEHAGRGANFLSEETRAARFEGFRILNAGNGEINAGGVQCQFSSPTLVDLWITGADVLYAAGLESVYGSPLLQNCMIESNTVWGTGGSIGLYWPGNAEVRDCILANTSVSGYGGGAKVSNTTALFERVHFVGNNAGISGGGLFCTDAVVTLIDCLFQGNEARDGAAISLRGSELIVTNCTFLGNYAWRFGAALYYDSQGDPSGGLVENCDFRGNNSAYGGIIQLMNSANPTLRNLSLVDNNHGDGIAAGCCGVGAIVENCLVAFNRGGYGIQDDPSGQSWVWVSCSNVFGNGFGEYEHGDQTGISGNISLDPLLCDPNFETLGLADSSPCLPEHNACGALMGNHGADCTLTAVGAPAPPGVQLEANYPNPFNPSTTIPFSLDAAASITLSIHDLSGRLVRVLAEQRDYPEGRHALSWDGREAGGQPAPSGVYFYRLETSAGATARPMLLVK